MLPSVAWTVLQVTPPPAFPCRCLPYPLSERGNGNMGLLLPSRHHCYHLCRPHLPTAVSLHPLRTPKLGHDGSHTTACIHRSAAGKKRVAYRDHSWMLARPANQACMRFTKLKPTVIYVHKQAGNYILDPDLPINHTSSRRFLSSACGSPPPSQVDGLHPRSNGLPVQFSTGASQG